MNEKLLYFILAAVHVEVELETNLSTFLFSASRQMPNHPGLTRGLVAVLLYYDGRKALVNALQALIQARAGLLWATDSLPQVTEFITAFTDSLVADGLLENIIGKSKFSRFFSQFYLICFSWWRIFFESFPITLSINCCII